MISKLLKKLRWRFLSESTINIYIQRYSKNLYLEKIRIKQNSDIFKRNTYQKVLICMHSFEWGGAEKFALLTVKKIIELNLDFHIFIEKKVDNPITLPFRLFDHQVTYATTYQNSAQQLINLINCFKPSLIHIHHSYSCYLALPNIKRNILVLDSLHIIEYQSGGYPYLAAENTRWINYHHVVSRGVESYLINELGVMPKKVILGYLLFDVVLQAKKRKWREDGLTIGFLGRFEKQKRPELFVELARYMHHKHSNINIQYLMQGEGSLKHATIENVKKYNLEDKFVFNNPNTDIDEFHEEIDVLLNCAENEGLTLIGVESALKETLFISTAVGQQHEITSSECLVSAQPQKFLIETSSLLVALAQDGDLRDKVIAEQYKKICLLQENDVKKKIFEVFYELNHGNI